MKISVCIRRAAALLLLVTLTAVLALPVLAEVLYPTPTDYIADDAAVLSEQTVKQIKETNDKLTSEIRAVIAVCTVKSTNGIEIGKYARSLYSEWKLPAGILIVVASEDNSFFLVPSTSVSAAIDNAALEEVRDQYIEDDFAAGKVDTAVRKAVTQLSVLMLRELKTDDEPASAPAQTQTAAAETTEKSSVGSIIIGIIKAILIIVLVALVLFVLLFVIALFNDDVAALMQKYIFRRGSANRQNNADYYDDRLYGDADRQRQYRSQNGQYRDPNNPRPSQNRAPVRYDENGYPIRPQNGQVRRNGQNGQNGQYRQNGQNARPQNRGGQVYYNADGSVRQQNPNRPRQSQDPDYYQANARRARQRQNSADAYSANQDGATRAYTIPNRNQNGR